MTRPVSWSEALVTLMAVAMSASFLLQGYGDLAGFVTVMAITAVVLLVVEPVLTFVHELGHALTAVALTPQRVMLYVGDGPDPLRLSIGRIDMRLSVRKADGRGGHIELLRPGLSRWRMFWIVVAGPAASAVAAVGLTALVVSYTTLGSVLFWTAAMSTLVAVLGVANLVPGTFLHQRLPGTPLVEGMTDGLIALKLLRGHPWVASESPTGPR